MSVKGDVLLGEAFTAKGQVSLAGAEIGGDLDCSGSFDNPEGDALTGVRMSVKGNVSLTDEFAAKGQVILASTEIGGDLDCSGGSFDNPEGDAFILSGAAINGTFSWMDITIQGSVDFSHAKVGRFLDDISSWPNDGQLELDGFEYEVLGGNRPLGAKDHITWLNLQWAFRSQPYEHLIRVLRHLGHERDAREVAIAKQVALRRRSQLGIRGRLWSLFLGCIVAHGYKPGRAFWLASVVIAVGWLFFSLAEQQQAMEPAKTAANSDPSEDARKASPDYPALSPLAYSVDVFLPIVNLHQESYWLPRPV